MEWKKAKKYQKKASGALTGREKKLAKRMLNDDWRNQDILALINTCRLSTVNPARIAEVKANGQQPAASLAELEQYIKYKEAYDLKTGLNPYKDERLLRSREAMMLAVQLFNSTVFQFKSEMFAVLANIAWTYLLHERLISEGQDIVKENGYTLALSEMLNFDVVDIAEPIKANLLDLKELRDTVEHNLVSRSDEIWYSLFQACALNYEKTLCQWFGANVSISESLGTSIQFARPATSQLAQLSKFDVPQKIQMLSSSLKKDKTADILDSPEYEFKVVYTYVSGSKSESHMKFVSPDSEEGKKISEVLVKYKSSDELYPYKAMAVVNQVKAKSGAKFSMHNHTMAWKKHKVRPIGNNPKKGSVNAKYCCFHPAHKDYTYNEAWVDLLVSELAK